ncbi:MAG TPA: TIGR02679 family protein [Chthoniobacterales bacterium]
MDHPSDPERLRLLFDRPSLRWIVDRLAVRQARERPLRGILVRGGATAEERRAVDDLLGRKSTTGNNLSLTLEALEEALREAGLLQELGEVVTACRGPAANRREEAARRRSEWDGVFDAVRTRCAGRPGLLRWVDDVHRQGVLKRMVKGGPTAAAGLLDRALKVIERFPCPGVLLANLAAECLGDSHALDRGQPAGTLCLRAIEVLHGIDGLRSADARRQAWSAAGVIIDDLSAPVLAFNLRGTSGSALEAFLELYRRHGLPGFFTYRQLQTSDAFLPLHPSMRKVFVCENPSVVSAAAREIGTKCLPLVCTNGQPASAVHLLLTRLQQAGAQVHAHADFDWAGLRIVDQLVREHAVLPWRMDAGEYFAAAGTAPLEPQPFSAAWAPDLSEALRRRGKAVFEEQVVGSLLSDLGQEQT